MNELQKVEFDLLKTFIKTCEMLNLKYYLVCGSALGAAKYDGFIPWDDDIDVAMLRPDYEVFIAKVQELLPENLFLQNYHTENVPHIFSKLRNSNTAYIEKSVAHLPMNHGVYIDIFPLDGYPDSSFQKKILELRKKYYSLKLSCVYQGERTWKSKIVYVAGKILRWDKKTGQIVGKLDALLSKYPVESSKYWCNHGNWQGKLEYAPREQYGEGTYATFEGMKVRIPECFDDYLIQKYGDWRSDLPVEEQKGHHYYEVLDLEKSYKEI